MVGLFTTWFETGLPRPIFPTVLRKKFLAKFHSVQWCSHLGFSTAFHPLNTFNMMILSYPLISYIIWYYIMLYNYIYIHHINIILYISHIILHISIYKNRWKFSSRLINHIRKVIMFVSLLENVLAQVLRAAISSQASRFVDNLSRVTFPLMAAGSMEMSSMYFLPKKAWNTHGKSQKNMGKLRFSTIDDMGNGRESREWWTMCYFWWVFASLKQSQDDIDVVQCCYCCFCVFSMNIWKFSIRDELVRKFKWLASRK